MGTSAIEGAKLGIPTILLDIAYGPLRRDYVFRWLFESSGYSLGFLVTPASYQPGNRSLEMMVDSVAANYRDLSQKSFEYCQRFHSLQAVGQQLVRAAAASRFQWNDIDPKLRRKSLLRRAYESVDHLRRLTRVESSRPSRAPSNPSRH
jgi:hypothetical protein